MQELLYLYGFVIENNPDDYLMVTPLCIESLKVYIFFTSLISELIVSQLL